MQRDSSASSTPANHLAQSPSSGSDNLGSKSQFPGYEFLSAKHTRRSLNSKDNYRTRKADI